jgi:hypothetical protein
MTLDDLCRALARYPSSALDDRPQHQDRRRRHRRSSSVETNVNLERDSRSNSDRRRNSSSHRDSSGSRNRNIVTNRNRSHSFRRSRYHHQANGSRTFRYNRHHGIIGIPNNVADNYLARLIKPLMNLQEIISHIWMMLRTRRQLIPNLTRMYRSEERGRANVANRVRFRSPESSHTERRGRTDRTTNTDRSDAATNAEATTNRSTRSIRSTEK